MMRAPDDGAAAVELRDWLTDLLHWDGLAGLHTTGLAQWQMWVLAHRTGHLTVQGPAGRAAKGDAKRARNGRGRGKASVGA